MDIKIKTYLTSDELGTIISDMKYVYDKKGNIVERKDAFNRHFTKVVDVAKSCAKSALKDCKSDDEVYNFCSENGLIKRFEEEVQMYNEIDKIIERDESVYNLMNETVDLLSKKVDELTSVSNIDKMKLVLSDAINKMKPMLEKANNGNK